ncbi:MAG TPA: NUDIX hydrolase [Tepidisphaeraceae bacterium]|nr:NUDIX hydrolase [Tepidisphaeraceae bacterium]
MDEPWKILAKQTIYDSDWVRIHLLDLSLPSGKIARQWHLIDYPRQASGIVPVGEDGRILLVDHHRFATQTRAWETPGGAIDAGETALQAAHRELREETGHAAREIVPALRYFPSQGSSNQVFNVFIARGVHKTGEICDVDEVFGVRWFTLQEIRRMIEGGQIVEGMTLTGLLWYFSNTRE